MEANFELHPETTTQISRTKLVRYQVNPRANWGPAGRAKNKAAKVDGSNKVSPPPFPLPHSFQTPQSFQSFQAVVYICG